MASADPRDADRLWLATLTVLYVEDDTTTRELLGHMLRRRVGRLLVAADAMAGLTLFGAEHPAIVITDIQMPKMDGLELAAAIRRLDAHVPIIVTTAFEQVGYLQRSIEAGVDKYVTKPVDTDKLDATLLACARLVRGEAELALARQHEVERLVDHEREALGLLSGGMAHDFNNLLQVLLAALEVATPLTQPTSELGELLLTALDSARQARELGAQLLTLSESWPAQMQVNSVAPTLRRALTAALSGGTTLLRMQLADNLPPVAQDVELLYRAWDAVATNAREAMGNAGVLTVTVQERTVLAGELAALPEGRYLSVTFQDTGPGLLPAVLPRIFDAYFTTKPRGSVRGQGLGLALCRAIVRRHHGIVTAASAPGEGAIFTVLLPVATSKGPA